MGTSAAFNVHGSQIREIFDRVNMKVVVAALSCLLFAAFANACRDKRDDCPFMKSLCKVHVDYLKKWCPVTCGHCGGPNPPTQGPPNPPTDGPGPNTEKPRPPGQCGNPAVQMQRVIAGKQAVPHSWPWQILMLKNGRGGCGGSIVSPTIVVTAAHCVHGSEHNPSSFSVRVGDHDTRKSEGTEATYQVKRVYKHPSYNPRQLDYDIALFELARPITFNKYVSPVCLPSADPPVGTKCYITGWGKTRHPGSMTNILQQAMLPVVSNDVCYAKNKNTIPIPITSRMVCSGDGGSSRKSGCHGDSGGPFVCNIGGRWELHGAVSHGSPRCSSSDTYTVFARVSYFAGWIRKHM